MEGISDTESDFGAGVGNGGWPDWGNDEVTKNADRYIKKYHREGEWGWKQDGSMIWRMVSVKFGIICDTEVTNNPNTR